MARLTRYLGEVRALQDALSSQYPELPPRHVDGNLDLAPDDLKLTNCLLETQRLEDAGKLAEAILTSSRS